MSQGQRNIMIGTVLILVVAIVVVIQQNPGLVIFELFTAGEFLQEIAPLFLVALFIERTLEVFMTAWREGESSVRKTKLQQAKKSDRSDESAEAKRARIEEAELRLAEYRSETRRVAFLAGLALGVFVASIGIRALEMFVDASLFATLPTGHQTAFRVADVVITGAVLGGGADGLHKIVSLFTGFLDDTNRRREERTAREVGSG